MAMSSPSTLFGVGVGRGPSRWRVLLVGCALVTGCSPSGECPTVDVEAAWASYEEGAISRAHADFQRAVEACPASGRAKLGLGYTSLRREEIDLAERMFTGAVEQFPGEADGHLGLGILRWRRGDFREAREALERALEIRPDDALARAYLQRFPPEQASAPRPPLERPDTLVFPSRVNGPRFEIRTASGWEPFFVRGVNIGAATPGCTPASSPTP
jgi:tetratricopeptide (TPR) repeat protein